ncbi:hypothetical protein RHODO2019_19095 (plasmid) [Rhodococcus antarcticus]|uniref:Repeat protein (TIGR01451 family) n=1 Tax=Rhodococcus antarcticus TaxID=2987751 RepID=A0ABY6P5Y2_9NOCA|nr:hypothetical protein [Rhodococcus antarcticus]UZJ27067.1 hypothetical protein RHODO2019_19095 [Rhodococcus antarcticus]
MTLSGAALPAGTITGTVSVYDALSAATGYIRIGGDHITVLAGPGQGLGSPGPQSPLVIYGDTSQDGIWYSGDPNEQAGHVFGPKPTIEPVGNDPNFVFPLAQPFQYSGNDVIDASALDAALTSSQLPTIGVTVYGGGGADTIIGSQTGDVLAGGSGNDTIYGQRGQDLIYGDSGINVDVLTRVVTVVTVNSSGLPNADTLFAGHDMIQGEGPGSAPSTAPNNTDNQDVIFGDHGQVVQDVQTVRQWLLDGDPNSATFIAQDLRPQAILTTGLLESMATVVPQNGVSDTIDGNLGNDIIFGGGGGDTLAGSEGNDLIFGDFGSVSCVQIGTAPAAGVTDPGCRIDASLLPLNVPLNDHTFTWTSLFTQASSNWGNDLITGGAGDDILIGGAGSDRISGGAGDDDIIGGNTGLALAGIANSGGAGGDNAGVDYSGGHVAYGDVFDNTGGSDGPHSACVAASCTYGDYLDGGAGNDVIAGDNANILRTGSTVSARFRVLTGTSILNTASGASNIAGSNVDGTTVPCAWVDGTGLTQLTCRADSYGYQADPNGVSVRYITLFDQSFTPPAGTYSDSNIAGGAGNDVLFGQLGNDWIQGDGSVITDTGQVSIDVQTRDTVTDPRQSVENYAGPGTDGADYIEGNGGNDVLYGNLGQDDLVGGSSNMFGLITRDQRPDGSDTIYGGAGTRTGINNPGDLSAQGHAADADVIMGDNGDIYQLVGANGSPLVDANGQQKQALAFLRFNYDNYSPIASIIPRSYSYLDYTVGIQGASDIGGADLIHGEGGDDVILGETGSDVLFGDGQNDTIIGGTGNDRIYGGAGDDAILGDDGYYKTSRNGLTEPLWDLTTPNATNVLQAIPGPYTQATTFQAGDLYNEARLLGYTADPTVAGAASYADIIYGGLGNDWIHGGGGDDAISGAEALPFYYSDIAQASILAQWGIDPTNPLLYNPSTTKFADYNAADPWSKIYDCTSGQKDIGLTGTCASGQKVDFFLNFTPYLLDPNGMPVHDAAGNAIKSNDGCDIIYGDNGNDWLVGGTDTNWLFGGFGDDLLQSSQNLETDGEHNRTPEAATWSDPTFAYGGAGRDVLIADSGRARMFDWTGEFNSFVVPFSPFGSPVVNRTFSPAVRAFIRALADAGGEDPTFVPNSPLDELALSTPQDSFWHSQHGAPRDPQPGNVPGVQIDYRGLVDLGAGCPCNPGDVIVVKGAVNAADPLHPTAAEDAEVPPGAVLAVSAALRLTYLVTNPGLVALKITSIVDDNGTPTTADDVTPVYVSGDTNGNGLLDPGETWLYTAVGVSGAPQTVTAGGHLDTVTVQGYDAATSVLVGSADPTSWTGTLPLLQIGKDINAVDPLHPTVTEQADTTATAPHLAAGSPVVFTYRVSTTSTTPLTVGQLTDDNGTPGNPADDWHPLPVLTTYLGQQYNVGDTNHDGLLGAGEVWLYTSAGVSGISTAAQSGWYSNIGTVSAVTADGHSYMASNPASYDGTTPTGAGAHVTLHTAVNALNPSTPTTSEDANTPPGAYLTTGTAVIYTYLVVNDGLVSLTSVSVSDVTNGFTPKPVLGAGGFNVGDTNTNNLLDPGETWLFTSTGVTALTAGSGLHPDTSSVTATPVPASQTPVGSTDPTYYTGVVAAIEVQKAVNAANPTSPTPAEDANNPATPYYVSVGAPVVFTYLVSAPTGLVVPGSSIVITDDNGTPGTTADDFHPTYVSGDTNSNGSIDNGEVWLYTSPVGPALPGVYCNTVSVMATVSGVGQRGQDLACYRGVTVAVQIKKATNAVDPLHPTVLEEGDNTTNQLVLAAGTPVTWTYRVTNPGTTAVLITGITDSRSFTPTPVLGADAVHNVGDTNSNGLLDPGEVWMYTSAGVATYTVVAGQFTSSATVTAVEPHLGTAATASDVSDHLGAVHQVTPAVTIVKAINALDPLHPTTVEDANTQPAKELLIGQQIVWTYTVTNTGNAPVTITALVDDNGTPASPGDDFTPTPVLGADAVHNVGDTNHNGLLDVGETWLFRATGTVGAGSYVNTARVTVVEPTTGQIADASDIAGYYGLAAAQGLSPGYWKNHPTAWPTAAGTPIFSTTQLVSTIFGPLPAPQASETLLEAIGTGGGGINALLRQAISALLNTTSVLIDYPLTASALIAAVNAALASGDPTQIDNLQTTLAGWNNLGASLTPPASALPMSASPGQAQPRAKPGRPR